MWDTTNTGMLSVAWSYYFAIRQIENTSSCDKCSSLPSIMFLYPCAVWIASVNKFTHSLRTVNTPSITYMHPNNFAASANPKMLIVNYKFVLYCLNFLLHLPHFVSPSCIITTSLHLFSSPSPVKLNSSNFKGWYFWMSRFLCGVNFIPKVCAWISLLMSSHEFMNAECKQSE